MGYRTKQGPTDSSTVDRHAYIESRRTHLTLITLHKQALAAAMIAFIYDVYFRYKNHNINTKGVNLCGLFNLPS